LIHIQGKGVFCPAHTPSQSRFDMDFRLTLTLLFSSYQSSGHWSWRTRACVSVEAAAVSAAAEDLLRAGERRHQPGPRIHSGQKRFNPELQARGSRPCKEPPCKEPKSGTPSVAVVSEELAGGPPPMSFHNPSETARHRPRGAYWRLQMSVANSRGPREYRKLLTSLPHNSAEPVASVSCATDTFCPGVHAMASPSSPRPSSPHIPIGSPYCSDPNCQSCKELRETQELIRTGRPLPNRKSA